MQNVSTPTDTPIGLCRLVGLLHTELVLGIERALVGAGIELNFSQFLALRRLGEHGPMAPGELARSLDYSAGALTRLLDKLEHLGYLQRVPDPNDRRALRLELTPAGRAVHTRMMACGTAAAERTFAKISGTERLQLRDVLLRVLNDLREERERIASH